MSNGPFNIEIYWIIISDPLIFTSSETSVQQNQDSSVNNWVLQTSVWNISTCKHVNK